MNLRRIAAVFVLGTASAVAAHATVIPGVFSTTGRSISDGGSSLVFSPNPNHVGAAKTVTLLTAGESGRIASRTHRAMYVPNSSALHLSDGSSMATSPLASSPEQTNGIFGGSNGTGSISANVAGIDPTMRTLLLTTRGTGRTAFPARAATPPAVPETSMLSLFGTGIFGLAGLVKRRLMA